ncbi:PAS domain S-box protein [Natrialba swarupiae]|nr:PAS domain S-box protein [Natrialba swarupiae]
MDVHSDGDERYADSDESTGGDGPSHADNGPPAGVASVDRPSSVGETGHTSEAAGRNSMQSNGDHTCSRRSRKSSTSAFGCTTSSRSRCGGAITCSNCSADRPTTSRCLTPTSRRHPEDRSTVRKRSKGDRGRRAVRRRRADRNRRRRDSLGSCQSRVSVGGRYRRRLHFTDLWDDPRRHRQKARERERERDRERLEVLFDESPNVIIVHDLEGNVIDVNQKHLENLGYDREEVSMHVSEFETGTSRRNSNSCGGRWTSARIGS